MRTFIGIDFSKETKDSIAKVQALTRQNAEKGRFKYIGNFHLTLKFLGEIDNRRSIEISRALQSCGAKHGRFDLTIDKLGFFNGRGSIHALWLGLGGDLEALSRLNESVEESMGNLGFSREKRPYTPHITIAQDLTLKIPFEELRDKVDFASFKPIHVKELQFIKSEEIGGKRVYTPIATFPLR